MNKMRFLLCFFFLLGESFSDKRRKEILLLPAGIALAEGIILGFTENIGAGIASLAGIGTGGIFLLLSFITKEKIGYGDGLVIASTGAVLGFRKNLYLLMFSLFLAALSGLWLLISKKAKRDTKLPFVPYMVPGLALCALSYFGGNCA